MRASAAILVPLAVAVLTACGNDPAPAPSAPAASAPAPMALNAAPVDVCRWLPLAEAERLFGGLSAPPEAAAPQGSLLGECTYYGAPGKLLSVSARPAHEYEATVEYATREGVNRPVDGLAGRAHLTGAGLMMQPSAKPYFVVIFGIGHSDETVLAVAKALQL